MTPHRRGNNRGVFFVALLLCVPLAVSAADGNGWQVEPVSTSNRNPFVAIQGLPPARGAQLLTADATRLSLHADAANTSVVESAATGRRTIIDGETHRLELDLRRGLGGAWEIGLTLPLLRHSGGFLDQPIEQWHDLFQLPNGNRDRLPRDRLLFSHSGPDRTGFRLDNAGGGIGDLQLSAGRRLGENVALRTTVKLPTGDSDRLTGSGASALATSLHAGGRFGSGLTWQVSGGLLITGDGDVLPEQRENLLGFGSGTLAWQVAGDWVLKAQLDGHTAAYKGTGEPLDRASLQLSLAVGFNLSPEWTLEAGFSEDIAVETAPDIVFLAGITRRF